MNVITTVRSMQEWADARRRAGGRLVLVPTMGALHEGHLALVREALGLGDHVVVSIFVNPTQFGPGEDFDEYPRNLDEDLQRLETVESKITVFAPSADEMYPDGPAMNRTWITLEKLDEHLCGRFRKGHFRGVATVVMKLFHACKPHAAVFGLKDAQQFVILRRMARDTLMDVDVVGVPTVREADGLAYSSRNAYLTPSQRATSAVLSKAVGEAERRVRQGELHTGALVESMRSTLERADGIRVEYAEVVDAETLQPVEEIASGQRVLVAVAAYFGSTRLIDSVFVRAPQER